MSRLPASWTQALCATLSLAAAGCGGGDGVFGWSGGGGDGGGGYGGYAGEPPAAVPGHPRLFVAEKDLDRLRSWARPDNRFYAAGVKANGERYKKWMDAGDLVLDGDCRTKDRFISCEWFMETFAFLSLVSPDRAERDDYARRAKKLLMHMIGEAVKGPADWAGYIRAPTFAVGDRSRMSGRAFGLTVDWIYPYLGKGDKEKIRQVFLRWARENVHAEVTSYNHPEPVGVFNDPVLLSNKKALRFAANNYFAGHGRNLGLMAMALDERDDPGGELAAYLDNATGAFLYMTDATLQEDAAGGVMAEGTQYGPQTMSYTMELLFALHTANLDDPAKMGEQVRVLGKPFWADVVPAHVHALAPAARPLDWPGPYFDYATHGDMETYEPYTGVYGDPILAFAPLGILAREAGDAALYDAIRWIELNLPPGGEKTVDERAGNAHAPLQSIGYFLLMDPDAPEPPDPRGEMPLDYYAPGMRFLFARTGWGEEEAYFTYQLPWTGIDHRHGDANSFGLHRKGEWITKEASGYIAWESAVHNTLSIENDMPSHKDSLSMETWDTGSQATYGAAGDGEVLARVVTETYAYALGDATALYNCPYNEATDVTHASRSIVWLKPDHVVVYDRAETKTAGRFKRFSLQAPGQPVAFWNRAWADTPGGQRMHFTSLLPQGGYIESDVPWIAYPAGGEPMRGRLTVESKDPSARFLSVVQGADKGAQADAATLVTGSGGTAFHAVAVKGTLVAFPVNLGDTFAGVTFDVPQGVERFLITGLAPGGGYQVTMEDALFGAAKVTVAPGAGQAADEGGVLAF